jgi:hypothetical protein
MGGLAGTAPQFAQQDLRVGQLEAIWRAER